MNNVNRIMTGSYCWIGGISPTFQRIRVRIPMSAVKPPRSHYLFTYHVCFPDVALQRRFHWKVYLRIFPQRDMIGPTDPCRCLKMFNIPQLFDARQRSRQTTDGPTMHFKSAPPHAQSMLSCERSVPVRVLEIPEFFSLDL